MGVPLLGFPGEYQHVNALHIPAKGGEIRVYEWAQDSEQQILFFPNPIGTTRMRKTASLLECQLIIHDYLSKEDSRSDTKEVPLPPGVFYEETEKLLEIAARIRKRT